MIKWKWGYLLYLCLIIIAAMLTVSLWMLSGKLFLTTCIVGMLMLFIWMIALSSCPMNNIGDIFKIELKEKQ